MLFWRQPMCATQGWPRGRVSCTRVAGQLEADCHLVELTTGCRLLFHQYVYISRLLVQASGRPVGSDLGKKILVGAKRCAPPLHAVTWSQIVTAIAAQMGGHDLPAPCTPCLCASAMWGHVPYPCQFWPWTNGAPCVLVWHPAGDIVYYKRDPNLSLTKALKEQKA